VYSLVIKPLAPKSGRLWLFSFTRKSMDS